MIRLAPGAPGSAAALGAAAAQLPKLSQASSGMVGALTRTFIPERPLPDGSMAKVEVDDAFVATVAFEDGAIGTLESTRFAAGRKNHEVIEINGENGSIIFDLERLNEMEVYWVGEGRKETQGFSRVLNG